MLRIQLIKNSFRILHPSLVLRIILALITLLPSILVAQDVTYTTFKPSSRSTVDDGNSDMFAGFSGGQTVEFSQNVQSGNKSSINLFKHTASGSSSNFQIVSHSVGNATYQVSSLRKAYYKETANSNGGGFAGSSASTSSQHSASNNKGNTPTFTGAIGNADVSKIAGGISSIFKPTNLNTTVGESLPGTEPETTDPTSRQNAPGDPPDPGDIPVGDGTSIFLLALGFYAIFKFKGAK